MRICTICGNPRRAKIDAALVGGGPYRSVAKRFDLSESALYRHQAHVPTALAKAERAREVAEAATLLGRVERLIHDCQTIAQEAQRDKEWHAAVSALREVRALVELLGQISGELKKGEGVSVNVTVNMARRALFEKMTRLEMDHYAVTRELPVWWPKGENGNGQRTIQ